MPQAVESFASTLEQLSEQLRQLDRRVAALEGQSKPAATTSPPMVVARPRPPAAWRGFPSAEIPGGAIPVLGKAVLGIAGAYLLRAIAESGAIPKLPVLIVAIFYAACWVGLAVQNHVTSRFASATYAITSALILSPLLWESTVRFQVLSPSFAAVVLVAFVVIALLPSWLHDLQLIPWVATLASVITAIALIIATHELVPLTAALLAVALVIEAAACFGHFLSLRAVAAIAADFAVWLLAFILASSEPIPEGYRSAAPATIALLCFLLLAIYAASIGVRVFALRRRLTILEIIQSFVAVALACFGALRATHASLAPALGLLFLLFAAVCYWGALSRFTEDAYARNRRVCATWAAALFLAGSFLLFTPILQMLFLCLGAALAAFVYTRTRKLSLGMHASFYLAAAVAISPLPLYAASALAGTVPGFPDFRVSVLVITAALCYAFGSRIAEDHRRRRLLWVIPALVVNFSAATIAVIAVVWTAAGRTELAASSLSVIRTIVNCVLALALGFLASRWHRPELVWVGYTAVAFGTLKLLFEDLRFGNATSLVVSLLFYGLILILIPRLTKRLREAA
jgi:hypothetical protein